MTLCCEGKSDIAERKCHSDIINMQVAYDLYQSSGRFWPIKSSLVNYVAHCYLDSSNTEIFSETNQVDSLTPLRTLVTKLCNDVAVISDEWQNTYIEC